MKMKKLMVFLLTAVVAFQITGIKTFAAENESTRVVTEDTASPAGQAKDQTADEAMIEETAVLVEENKEEDKKTEEKETAEGKTEEEGVLAIKEAVEMEEEVEEEEEEKEKAPYSEEELKYMASIIYCEAGNQPYAGKLAVGIVVKNRMESSRFPNSIKGVLTQRGQFGPASNGSLSRTVSRYEKGSFQGAMEKECIRAAKEALSGVKTVSYSGEKSLKGFYYFNTRVSGRRLQIAAHQFK